MLLLVVLFAVSRMEGESGLRWRRLQLSFPFLGLPGNLAVGKAHHPAWQGPETQLPALGVAGGGGTSPHTPLASALREPRALAEGCFSYDVILIAVQMSLDLTITRLSELLVMIALCPAPLQSGHSALGISIPHPNLTNKESASESMATEPRFCIGGPNIDT